MRKHCISSERSSVYHQFHRNCISSMRKHCISSSRQYTHLRCDDIQHGFAVLMRCSLTADDIPSLSAWIKKEASHRLASFLVEMAVIEAHASVVASQPSAFLCPFCCRKRWTVAVSITASKKAITRAFTEQVKPRAIFKWWRWR